MENKLIVGEITKPQGVMGELKVRPYTDDANRFKKLKSVYIDGVEYGIIRVRVAPDAVFLVLKGVADRNSAELLRGKMLEVARENCVPLDEGKYFIVDVLGSSLETENGVVLGTIFDIVTSGRKDIYYAKTKDGKSLVFPLLKDVLVEIDINAKKVVVKEKRFNEICLYED